MGLHLTNINKFQTYPHIPELASYQNKLKRVYMSIFLVIYSVLFTTTCYADFVSIPKLKNTCKTDADYLYKNLPIYSYIQLVSLLIIQIYVYVKIKDMESLKLLIFIQWTYLSLISFTFWTIEVICRNKSNFSFEPCLKDNPFFIYLLTSVIGPGAIYLGLFILFCLVSLLFGIYCVLFAW